MYGTIVVDTAWTSFRELEPELVSKKKILKKDFMAFTDILRVADNSENKDVNGNPIKGQKLQDFVFWKKRERDCYNHAKRDEEKAKLAAEYNLVASAKLMNDIESYIQRDSALTDEIRITECIKK